MALGKGRPDWWTEADEYALRLMGMYVPGNPGMVENHLARCKASPVVNAQHDLCVDMWLSQKGDALATERLLWTSRMNPALIAMDGRIKRV